METPAQDDADRRQLLGVAQRILSGDCVLVLGPRVAIRAADPDRRSFDELLARYVLAETGDPGSEGPVAPADLRHIANRYDAPGQDRSELEFYVRKFYEAEAGRTTDFHRELARLPFRLCISASPDSLMLTAYKEVKKSPQRGHYNFRKAVNTARSVPNPETPLVYYLFGHHEDLSSLILSEADLIEFLVKIVQGIPAIPDVVRSIINDDAASFLFLGFGFQNWYLRVLLQVLGIHKKRTKAIAFEDATFFADPEHEKAVAFFSGDRRIDFRPLRWEVLALQLRQALGSDTPANARETTSMRESPAPNAPKAFVSYASEDRAAVDALAEQLQVRGIQVWQDQQDLRAGDDWNQVLLDVIAGRVDYVVVVQTPAMTTAISGVFNREIDTALQKQKDMGEFEGQQLRFVIPVKLGACEPLSKFEKRHMIDVGSPEGIDALAASIKEDWHKRGVLKSRVPGDA